MKQITINDVRELNYTDCIKVINDLYIYRYTCNGYYDVYEFICNKFNIKTALLPHREYRYK